MDEIQSAFINKKIDQLNELLNAYLQVNDKEKVAKTYYYIGCYHEYYGDKDTRHLIASEMYRKSLEINPTNYARYDLVSLFIKTKTSNFNEIKKIIDEMALNSDDFSVDLAYAALFFYKTPPNYNKSKNYFLKAAKCGAIYGLFGYSICSRKLGMHFRATAVDILRLILTPFLKAILGKKSSLGYFWASDLKPFL